MNQQTRPSESTLPFLPLALAMAVILWATYLRLHNIAIWPPGLSHDEAINGLDAMRLLRTGVIPFYLRDGRPEPLFRFFQAMTIALIGPTRFGLRLASLFTGILTVAAAYRAGRHFAPPGSDARRRVGLITAGVMAVMVGHIHLSRVAYRAILQPFAMMMLFDAFVLAWESRNWRHFAAAGVWLGVALMSYTAAFVLLAVVTLGIIQRAVVWLADLPDSISHGTNLFGVLVFTLAFLLAIVPLLLMLRVQPELFGRAGEVGRLSPGSILASPHQLAARLQMTWRMIAQQGDINPQYDVAKMPILHGRVLYGLLLAGIVACVLRPRRLASWVALGYLGFGLLPVAFSKEIPHGLRIAGEYAAVPLVITASFGLVLWLAGRVKRPAWSNAVHAAYLLLASGVLIVAALQSAWIYSGYFQKDVRWGVNGVFSAFSWFFETRRLEMAELIADAGGVVYVPLSEADDPALRYFTMKSHPRVATFATYFPEQEPLELPAGRFLVPPGAEDATTFAAYMPGGTLVLLPRFDDATLADLRAALADGDTLLDDYGEVAATVVDYPASGSAIAIEEPIAHPLGTINYANQIGLVGWDAASELPQSDGEIAVTLYFTPGTARRRDVTVFTQLWNIGGERIASGDEPLLHRWLYPPDQWWPDDVVPIVIRQPVPENLTPGAYHVAVGVRDWRQRNLPVLGVGGAPVADTAIAAVVKVPRTEAVSTEGMIPVNAYFGGEIVLLGYQITGASSGEPVRRLAPGEAIVVTLYWKATRRPDEDYTIFVHLSNAQDELIAQNDSQPEGGQYPTGIWDAGEVVATTHLLIPPESSGPYTLYTGLYSWPSLERLPVSQDGEIVEDRRATLGVVP